MMIQSDRCKSLKLSKNMLPNRRLPNGNHHHTHLYESACAPDSSIHPKTTICILFSLRFDPPAWYLCVPCIDSCDVTVELMLWLLSWLSFCECCGCYVHELIFCVFQFFLLTSFSISNFGKKIFCFREILASCDKSISRFNRSTPAEFSNIWSATSHYCTEIFLR